MQLNRRGCGLIGILTVAVLAGYGWYSLRPKLRYATRQEVEAVIDPRLLAPLPRDLESEKRYERISQLLKGAKRIKQTDPQSQSAILKWAQLSFQANKTTVLECLSLYERGAIPPKPENPYFAFPNLAEVKNLVKQCALAGLADAADGKMSEATEKLILANRIAEAYTREGRTLIEHLVAIAVLAIVDHSAAKLARSGKLDEEQLRRLLSAWQPLDPDRKIIKQVIVGEFQNYTLPMLPKMGSDFPMPKGLGDMFDDSLSQHKDEKPVGQYDAIETAKLANKVALATLENAGRPYPKIDKSIDSFVEELTKDLPEDLHSDMEPGVERSAREFWYRAKMNNLSNSLGRSLVSTVASETMTAGARSRTLREAVRGIVAIELYQAKTAKLPKTLDMLVSEGLMKSVPWDHMDDKPLRYDPAKRLIWSVGVDLKDHGGSVSKDFNFQESDWGFPLKTMLLIKPAAKP